MRPSAVTDAGRSYRVEMGRPPVDHGSTLISSPAHPTLRTASPVSLMRDCAAELACCAAAIERWNAALF
jgi:hypothetical protein